MVSLREAIDVVVHLCSDHWPRKWGAGVLAPLENRPGATVTHPTAVILHLGHLYVPLKSFLGLCYWLVLICVYFHSDSYLVEPQSWLSCQGDVLPTGKPRIRS